MLILLIQQFVVISKTNNPFVNLAHEWYLQDVLEQEAAEMSKRLNKRDFREYLAQRHILYLWRNNPVVVIGRHQDPYAECNVEALKRENVVLARRRSGGGAVYQDLGNTNFTFITSSRGFAKTEGSTLLIEALKRHNISASLSGRNDVTVGGAKVSGTAYTIMPFTALQHGTVLRNVDMERMARVLTPSRTKLKVNNLVSFHQKNYLI